MADGKLSIHRVKRLASDDPSRAIQTLQMELQQIMKGKCLLRVPVQQPQGHVLCGGDSVQGGHHSLPACPKHWGGAAGGLWFMQLRIVGCLAWLLQRELLTVFRYQVFLLDLTPVHQLPPFRTL